MPSSERESGLCERAVANYVTFCGLSPEKISVGHVARTFGRISGWAFLTKERLEEAPETSSKEDHIAAGGRSPPSCIFRLTRTLQATRFNASIERIALTNFMKFHRLNPQEATSADVEASVPGVLGWAMPTFSCAKENYERFKKIDPGKADLKEVLLSSAGLFGWASYSSGRPSPSPASSSLMKRGASSNLSSQDSTEDSETDPGSTFSGEFELKI
jgi:hypothetical protein